MSGGAFSCESPARCATKGVGSVHPPSGAAAKNKCLADRNKRSTSAKPTDAAVGLLISFASGHNLCEGPSGASPLPPLETAGAEFLRAAESAFPVGCLRTFAAAIASRAPLCIRQRGAADSAGCRVEVAPLFAFQLLAMASIAASRVASKPCHGWRRSPRKGRLIDQNHGLLRPPRSSMRPIISAFAITSYSLCVPERAGNSLGFRKSESLRNSVGRVGCAPLGSRLTAAVPRPRRGAQDIPSHTHRPCVAAHQQLRRSNYAKTIGWFVPAILKAPAPPPLLIAA